MRIEAPQRYDIVKNYFNHGDALLKRACRTLKAATVIVSIK